MNEIEQTSFRYRLVTGGESSLVILPSVIPIDSDWDRRCLQFESSLTVGERHFIINVGGLELVRAFLGFKYSECVSIERSSGVTGAARMQRKHDHRVPSSPVVREHGAKVLA